MFEDDVPDYQAIWIREAFQTKSGETWETVQSGDDPPPLAGLGLFWTWDFIEMGWPPPLKSTWDFFELGIFLKRNDPLKFFRN